MNIGQIEANLQKIINPLSKETFIYDLMLSYNLPKASITRLQKGNLNLSKINGEIDWKKKLFFKEVRSEEVYEIFAAAISNSSTTKHDPRFVIITDYQVLLAYDTKTKDTLDIPIENIVKHFDFFLPWAGMEKTQHQNENPADVKAAERMAKLYDEIEKDNPTNTTEEIHNLNVFLSRLLFCFFAEDTGIFLPKGLFTNAIASYTQEDGSDLATYLDRLFEVLNTEIREKNLPAHYNIFPYVNGGLFANKINIPSFTRKSRQAIIDSGREDWSAINPDIFGSMIQAVISPEHRGSWGMHYTSVPNIMKVIKPLFLDELYEEFEKAKQDHQKLRKLLARIAKIKIFDPACGSGNFLIIAYKELRLLELKILTQLKGSSNDTTGFEEKQIALFGKPQLSLATAASSFQIPLFSCIELQNLYGIELDDFAHEIAILSLWLAQHQMNVQFKEIVGHAIPSLPLRAGGNIIQGNATRLDWQKVCPKTSDAEVYILSNPPYLGFRGWSNSQKEDMEYIFKNVGNVLRLDYIACWFKKATDYIVASNAKFAFVSTSSICQGEQVSLIWPYILSKKLEISFAYQPFDWENNAKDKAGVTCIIVGIQNKLNNQKFLFGTNRRLSVDNIGPYLVPSSTVIVEQRTKPISQFSEMALGSSGIDGGHLMLSLKERNDFISAYPETEKFIKPFLSGGDFLNGIERFCLWIDDEDLQVASKIKPIQDRIEKCKIYRRTAGRDAKKAATVPHRFYYRKYKESNSIIVPRTSSGRRKYLPCGFIQKGTVISNQAFVIYEPDTFIFGILSSKMHCIWMEITSGKMRHDYSYSVNLTYNTFPFPKISNTQNQGIEKSVYQILQEREHYPEKTLAQLYDPEKMPQGLREAHHLLDTAIESCYRSKPFTTDEERLEFLFKLYEAMREEERNKQ